MASESSRRQGSGEMMNAECRAGAQAGRSECIGFRQRGGRWGGRIMISIKIRYGKILPGGPVLLRLDSNCPTKWGRIGGEMMKNLVRIGKLPGRTARANGPFAPALSPSEGEREMFIWTFFPRAALAKLELDKRCPHLAGCLACLGLLSVAPLGLSFSRGGRAARRSGLRSGTAERRRRHICALLPTVHLR